MGNPRVEEVRHGEPASGYAASGLIFAGMTALWAIVVRDDPYYRVAPVLGVQLPLTMLAYLVVMPVIGLFVGLWRYDRRHHGGAFSFGGKLIARGVHFTYAHSLLVLFTVAMATDYFLGLNLDEQVKAIDDRFFDVAARFAPWLASYLAGFNFGRATRISRDYKSLAGDFAAVSEAKFGDEAVNPPALGVTEKPTKKLKAPKPKKDKKRRAEPVLGAGLEPLFDQGDLARPEPALTSSGLPQPAAAAPLPAESGFLPPQDFSKLRPGLRELR